MTSYASYPETYRADLIAKLVRAVAGGDSVALLGLSGSGKSNVANFLTQRPEVVARYAASPPRMVLVDCNRLPERTPQAFFRLALRALDPTRPPPPDFPHPMETLDAAVAGQSDPICLLLDRFDDLARVVDRSLFNNLRAMRDAYKYHLTYVAVTRHPLERLRPLEDLSEFVELFAHVLRLGAFSESDSRWNVTRFAERQGIEFAEAEIEALIALSGGYAGLLRGALEAWAATRVAGQTPSAAQLLVHPGLQARLVELWDDIPQVDQATLMGLFHAGESDSAPEHLRDLGLVANPLLAAFVQSQAAAVPVGLGFNSVTDVVTRDAQPLDISLTPKERLLLAYLVGRPGEVCDKDGIIRAVWPEDAIFEKGVRDDSLAQIVRRLREKVEHDPSRPQYVITVPGRGYKLAKGLTG